MPTTHVQFFCSRHLQNAKRTVEFIHDFHLYQVGFLHLFPHTHYRYNVLQSGRYNIVWPRPGALTRGRFSYSPCKKYIQWNLCITDTFGTEYLVLYKEVVLSSEVQNVLV